MQRENGARALARLADVAEERRYGGKAAGLGAALRAGLPVPAGIAVPYDFLDELVEGRGSRSPRGGASASGQGSTSASGQDRDLRSRLLERIEGLEGPYVVRSSGIGEDGEAASFAGQHRTVVNVLDGDGVIEALETVHASARSETVMEYRERMGIEGRPKMGAVVQTMVDADVSGVLFTRNPVDGSDERVVEAAPGLGEAVVDGLVTPDRYRMRPGGAVVEREAGCKDVRVVPIPEGGTRTEPVPDADQDRLCLDDDRLLALDRLADRCERYRSGGHDVEWAFVGETLYLLQRRDITTGP